MTLLALARAAQDLQERAVQRDLKAAELKGGTFSVLHREDSTALAYFPLVNPPECAALCLGAVRQRPVVADDAIAIRPLACLSLSFDQRILTLAWLKTSSLMWRQPSRVGSKT
jgi:pyruvate/2-oxoglutarate dehydrogenase complex dihydrolipoamide acyltransferase (E2) component